MINPLLKVDKALSGIVKRGENSLLTIAKKANSTIPWSVIGKVQGATIAGKGLFNAYAPASMKKTPMFYIEYVEDNPEYNTALNQYTMGSIALRDIAPQVQKKMYFDAVFRTEHLSARQITSHPVQTGANISDHSYKIPSTLSMDVGVSDVMANFNPMGLIFSNAKSKSVNAFEELLKIQDSGNPITVYTRLKKYENMIIERVSAREDAKTLYELRAQIQLQEVIIATGVKKDKVSADFSASKITQSVNKQAQDIGAENKDPFLNFAEYFSKFMAEVKKLFGYSVQ
jgi:hypothetical protein